MDWQIAEVLAQRHYNILRDKFRFLRPEWSLLPVADQQVLIDLTLMAYREGKRVVEERANANDTNIRSAEG